MRSKRWPLPSRTHIRTRRNEARPVGEDAGPVPPDGGSEVGSVGGWVKTRAQGGGFVEEKRSRRSAGHHRPSPRPRPGSRGEPRDTPVPGPASRDPALVGPMPPPQARPVLVPGLPAGPGIRLEPERVSDASLSPRPSSADIRSGA